MYCYRLDARLTLLHDRVVDAHDIGRFDEACSILLFSSTPNTVRKDED
jgi:hypothetical protein